MSRYMEDSDNGPVDLTDADGGYHEGGLPPIMVMSDYLLGGLVLGTMFSSIRMTYTLFMNNTLNGRTAELLYAWFGTWVICLLAAIAKSILAKRKDKPSGLSPKLYWVAAGAAFVMTAVGFFHLARF